MAEELKVQVLDFERPLFELKDQLAKLQLQEQSGLKIDGQEIKKLEKTVGKTEKQLYSNLTPWNITQIARHPNRPSTLDFFTEATTDSILLYGDRFFRDDPSIVGGFAKIDQIPFMIIGHQKGKNTLENVKRNFGMPHPEGYKKAMRLMELAARFSVPILTFIDTPGAFPGIEAEERQQSTAIAENLRDMGQLPVPIITVILGEGGSGGALAIGVANRVLMMQNSIYSVISPEGCASILWNEGGKRFQQAAEILKCTSKDLYNFGIVEEIISEPINGAHNDPQTTIQNIKKSVLAHYKTLQKLKPEVLMEQRYKRFRRMGEFTHSQAKE